MTDVATGLEALPNEFFALPEIRIRQYREEGAEFDKVPCGSWFTTNEPSYHSLGRDIVILDVSPIPDGGLQLTLFDLVIGYPCAFLAQNGKALQIVKELLTSLQTKCIKHNLPMWHFAVFGLTQRATSNTWFPVFGMPFLLEDEAQIEMHRKLREKFKSSNSQVDSVTKAPNSQLSLELGGRVPKLELD